ncbi:hypothetical protein PMAYCL1PPCAC_19742, partial [Pristionchus mayeri]
FGDRRLFIIVQICALYCILCWGVALYIFSLLVHSAHYEFTYFNEQLCMLNDKYDCPTDDAICDYILQFMKDHKRLVECVRNLDRMFSRYAFLMITTIIPTTMFSFFMIFQKAKVSVVWELLMALPLMSVAIFAFFALVDGPSKLHYSIYNTKSSICANTSIWFPYRTNVYHSALAFVSHLEQANLGISIWEFAVVSKQLVLTTVSAMVTCLALFLEVSNCNGNHPPMSDKAIITNLN